MIPNPLEIAILRSRNAGDTIFFGDREIRQTTMIGCRLGNFHYQGTQDSPARPDTEKADDPSTGCREFAAFGRSREGFALRPPSRYRFHNDELRAISVKRLAPSQL
jgi:hypothetical protein